MSNFVKDVLEVRLRRGDFGDKLASKINGVDAYTEVFDGLREIADSSPSSPVSAKLAAILVDNHDRLEALPRVEAFRKVGDAAADAAFAMQRAVAERQLLGPSPASMYQYYATPRRSIGYSPTLYHLGQLARFWDDKFMGIPNRPGPLSSMVVLGSLGALAGRGSATAADKLQGTDNKLRKNLWTALGGAAGVIPGLAYAGLNASSGAPTWTGASLDTPFIDKKGASTHTALLADVSKTASVFTPKQMQDMLDDPYVANRLPPLIAPAAMGLVEGAANMPGSRRDLPIVTPVDVARMAVGLGSGYLSGMIVGKTLGGLLGVSDSTQQVLRRSGAAAGLLKSVIPLAYGQ